MKFSCVPAYNVLFLGFGGVYAMYKFRQLGLNVKAFEAGGDFGGVWFWNRYPGARVDSEFPFYQLSIPEVYRKWDYGLRFPDHKELRQHFAHIDKTLGLRKDVQFDARVNSAEWNEQDGKWTVQTEAGHVARCKYLFLATGLLHRKHYPDFPGLSDFKGAIHHSGFWPEDLDVKGKKVAVIGAGATSVQIVQEVAKEAGQLTMLMRRPSYCIPMQQRKITHEEQAQLKAFYPNLFKAGRASRSGFPSARGGSNVFDVPEKEREELWEEMWNRGAFNFLFAFEDVAMNLKANRAAYDFWAKKIRSRMNNPAKRDLMAPVDPPYLFGTKRTPLEADYYECLDQDNVEIVNLNQTPLQSFNEKGMVMEDGKQLDFDIVILATGFDSFSGS
jgi:cation diffusion facilitator CzcD-associated flavoprotein CzcO